MLAIPAGVLSDILDRRRLLIGIQLGLAPDRAGVVTGSAFGGVETFINATTTMTPRPMPNRTPCRQAHGACEPPPAEYSIP